MKQKKENTEQFNLGSKLTKELLTLWYNYGDEKRLNNIVEQLYSHYKEEDEVYEGFLYQMSMYGGQDNYNVKKTLKDIWNNKTN